MLSFLSLIPLKVVEVREERRLKGGCSDKANLQLDGLANSLLIVCVLFTLLLHVMMEVRYELSMKPQGAFFSFLVISLLFP